MDGHCGSRLASVGLEVLDACSKIVSADGVVRTDVPALGGWVRRRVCGGANAGEVKKEWARLEQ